MVVSVPPACKVEVLTAKLTVPVAETKTVCREAWQARFAAADITTRVMAWAAQSNPYTYPELLEAMTASGSPALAEVAVVLTDYADDSRRGRGYAYRVKVPAEAGELGGVVTALGLSVPNPLAPWPALAAWYSVRNTGSMHPALVRAVITDALAHETTPAAATA